LPAYRISACRMERCASPIDQTCPASEQSSALDLSPAPKPRHVHSCTTRISRRSTPHSYSVPLGRYSLATDDQLKISTRLTTVRKNFGHQSGFPRELFRECTVRKTLMCCK